MKFGVIGWGLRRSIAKLAHAPSKDRYVVALADTDVDAHVRFRDEIGRDVANVDDFRDLFGLGLDAIFVLSPDFLHEEHAIACLEAGIPVYLEKPMAITIEGCDRILATAERSGTKLYLGHNMRHFPVIRKMKEWIEAGYIGDVKTAWCRQFVSYGGEAYFQDWHADRTKTTGLLLQKGAHDIDVLHWLCDGYSKRVTAMGKLAVYGDIKSRRQPGEGHTVRFTGVWPPTSLAPLNSVVDIEDISMMQMELKNGVLAAYQQCHFAPDAWRNYTVIGSHGRIENFGDIPGNAVVRVWNSGQSGYRERADIEFTVPDIDPALGAAHGGADGNILEEFFRYLSGEAEPSTTPLDARMCVAAGVCATHSLRNGSIPVDVPGLVHPGLVHEA